MVYLKRIQRISQALFLTIKRGPRNLQDKAGRPIHYKTEYTIKVNSMLIVRDIFRLIKFKKKHKDIDKYLSFRNFLIWKIHILSFEIIHFFVLFDYQFEELNEKILKHKYKKRSLINRLKTLKYITLFYLFFKIIFLILVSIKGKILLLFKSNKNSKKDNFSKRPKLAVLFETTLSKLPRSDLYLYDYLEYLKISKDDPIVVFYSDKIDHKLHVLYNHNPGYIFYSLPKPNIISLLKIIKFTTRSLIKKSFNLWLYDFFFYEFNLNHKFIKKIIKDLNIKAISVGDSFLAERNIFYYSSKTNHEKITFISRERSVWEIHDKWSRDFILTDIYLTLMLRDNHIAAKFNKKFIFPYKVNSENYKKYSALNTKISTCKKKILIFTSNFSLNIDPFGQQKIHPMNMEPFLNTLYNYLIKKPSLGVVFKCKKIGEREYLMNWLSRNPKLEKQIDIILPPNGIPLLELTNGYHHFISITPFCVPSTNFELSCLIKKESIHFIDFAEIYSTSIYSKNISLKKKIENLPFKVHKNLEGYFNSLHFTKMKLSRKYSISEYNKNCEKQLKIFIAEISK